MFQDVLHDQPELVAAATALGIQRRRRLEGRAIIGVSIRCNGVSPELGHRCGICFLLHEQLN